MLNILVNCIIIYFAEKEYLFKIQVGNMERTRIRIPIKTYGELKGNLLVLQSFRVTATSQWQWLSIRPGSETFTSSQRF